MYQVNAAQFPADDVNAPGAAGVKIQWLVDEPSGAPNFAMRRFTIAAGGHTPRHAHPWEHEVYILSGRGVVVIEGKETPIAANDAILVPPGEDHQFRADSDSGLEFLCLVPNGLATVR
jgi:quercetin dioxygenase-like cupin family protein